MGFVRSAVLALPGARRFMTWLSGAPRSLGDLASFQNWQDSQGDFASTAGARVSPDTAMQLDTVHACVRVIAETMASLPVKMHRELPNGTREPVESHPLLELFDGVSTPDDFPTWPEMAEIIVAELCLRGKGFAQVQRNRIGEVVSLAYLPTPLVSPEREAGGLVFRIRRGNDRDVVLSASEVWRPRNFCGLSPVELARNQIGLAMQEETHGARAFSQGCRPAGVLTVPGTLSETAEQRLRQQWERIHGGADNAGRTAILHSGATWVQMGLDMHDAQWLEACKYSAERICRIWRVPPRKVGLSSAGTSRSNVEQDDIDFAKHAIRPWCVRLESSMQRDLLSPEERKTIRFSFDMSALLRGDVLTRYRAHQIGLTSGFLKVNEVRRAEGLAPVPGGDIVQFPLNMGPRGALGQALQQPFASTDDALSPESGTALPEEGKLDA